ncbi:hypothetical protein BJX62DRAFT_109700 [Aspergillus germanicus]
MASASSYLPCRASTEPSWLTLVRVSASSAPHALSRISRMVRNIISASLYLPSF